MKTLLRKIISRNANVKIFIVLLVLGILSVAYIKKTSGYNDNAFRPSLSRVSRKKLTGYRGMLGGVRTSDGKGGFVSSITEVELLDELSEYVEPTKLEMDQYLKTSPGLDIQPPIKFLPDYKNPCWYMSKRVLHCLPAYYILGYPKCATTDIWYKIAQHPQIVTPVSKEMHWWSGVRFRGGKEASFRMFYTNSLGKAVSAAAGNKENTIIGDASPDTTWETRPSYRWMAYNTRLRSVLDAPRILPASVIKRYTPKAKFIFMMRNPTDRVYSHHLYEGRPTVQIGKAPVVPRSQNMFHLKVTQMIGQLQDCFQRRSVRACVYDPNLLHEAADAKVLLQPGLYAVFISDWLKIFPREQFLYINTDEYSHNQGDVLKTAFEFLDVDIPTDHTIEKVKDAVRPNSRTINGVDIGPMWNATRELLDEFYKPFNRALAEILGDDRFLFRKEAPGVKTYRKFIKKSTRTRKTRAAS